MDKLLFEGISNIDKEKNDISELYDKIIYENNLTILKKFCDDDLLKLIETESVDKLIKILRKVIFDNKKYCNRLFKEFKLILKFNFQEVFYQVYQILNLAGDIPHIIRGSAGSCLLCFLMGITDIDPIKENISLSRFMHDERQDMPDIDIDFPSNRRDYIYKKIFIKWNKQVARISNHILYKERSAYREAIRKEGHRKFVPREYNLKDIFDDSEQINNINKNAKELIGTFRCYSLHCGGIVIFPNSVPDNLYLKDFEIDNNFTGPQIWMNKDQVEDADMIKIDILSNRGLCQLWDINKKPIADYPIDDEKTLKLFQDGMNIGLTHSESRAMMKVYKTMRPTTIKEIAIALALIRPAASKNFQKSDFLKDYSIFKYDNKKFVIFDDDATLFIKKLLDCDDSVADNYRRAFSKNKKKLKYEFTKLLEKKITDKNYRDEILVRLEQLEYYSFCKSHAYSYAQLVWALAYNKVHNPKEFWLSTLNNCNTSYRKWVHFREAKKAGLKLNLGKKPYRLENNEIIPSKYEKKEYTKQIDQLVNCGYWISDNFLNGMYYEEYWLKLTKKHTKLDKTIIENDKIKYAKFKGLIATGRGYKKDDNKGYITFVTISTEDGIYHDLVLYGYHKVCQMLCISGFGKIKFDGYVKWIEVSKFKSEWIN